MLLGASCPRCPASVQQDGDVWRCADHGVIVPLWRPEAAGYEPFVAHLAGSASFPTLLPWPMREGWWVSDFGRVGLPDAEPVATFTSCGGNTALDGYVEITVVSEEPGVGLGSRCAGTDRADPGAEIGGGAPPVKLRLAGHPIALWPVPTWESVQDFDRSVFAGEAHGRWLWLVIRPASAALLLNEEPNLLDVRDLGLGLVDLPFGGSPSSW